MTMTRCDATYDRDAAGNVLNPDRLIETSPYLENDGPLGVCSNDRVTIWHGMTTPAIACGRHATYRQQSVFRGHRHRLAQSN